MYCVVESLELTKNAEIRYRLFQRSFRQVLFHVMRGIYMSNNYNNGGSSAGGNKIAAGICGILLGFFGVHKFILGYTKEGLIMLLVSILTCGIAAPVMFIIGFIEGIVYLTQSDSDFENRYVNNHRGWF